MTLRSLLAKRSDAKFLGNMIGYTDQRLRELEVKSRTRAAYGTVPASISQRIR